MFIKKKLEPLKSTRAKSRILELHQNKVENPQIKKNTSKIISRHAKPPK